MATMLSLIQQATGEMGLGVPTFVAGNTAQDQIQQLALLNAVGNELAREWDWQALTTEYRFNTAAVTTTGTLTSGSQIITGIPSTTGITTDYMVTGTGVATDVYVQSVDSSTQVTITVPASANGSQTIYFSQTKYSAPPDYDRPVNRTQWDKTQHWEMLGPETQQQWQWLKSGFISTGPRTRYIRLGNKFQIWPPSTTSRLLGYVYQSKNWALDNAGVGKAGFTADTDTCIFPDVLMVLGLKAKYFEVKGFGPIYTEQFEAQKSIAKAADQGAPTLSFAPQISQVLIGVANLPDSGYGT